MQKGCDQIKTSCTEAGGKIVTIREASAGLGLLFIPIQEGLLSQLEFSIILSIDNSQNNAKF